MTKILNQDEPKHVSEILQKILADKTKQAAKSSKQNIKKEVAQ